MDPAAESKKDYIDALNHFLLKTFSSGGNAVLLIDEAQNLSHTVLEQIRMLSNLETEKEKLIQIVLVGQPELKELLVAPSLRQLDERIMVRYDLRPLDYKDIKGYVEHRLVVAGSQGNLSFSKGAFKKVYAYSQGNPRRINSVCDRSLLIAYARGKHTVSKGVVVKAIDEIRGDMKGDPTLMDLTGRRVKSVAILVLLLVMFITFAGWNFRRDILGLFSHEQKFTVVRTNHVPRKPLAFKKKAGSLFLDEQSSRSGLFMLFNTMTSAETFYDEETHYRLFSLNIGPEYYVMLKKPFRIHLSSSNPSSLPFPRYLLIREVTDSGAIAIDAEDKARDVTRDFILRHWGAKVSWFYPYKNKKINFLVRGMSSPEVIKVQMILNKIGYLLEPTGFYGKSTFHEVMRFQKDFGLAADGIVGPQTMALLYLVT